jgi:alpha-glucoside transport system substrate-binding protein
VFASGGYQVPTTWDELTALTRRMIADGRTPWCVAARWEPESGWSIASWLDALVLRTGGPELYDRWTRHEVAFDDEAVRRAGRLLDDVLFAPGSVFGGQAEMLSRDLLAALDPMTEDPPACLMSEGGDLINGVQPADDYDFFYLPPVLPTIKPPMILSGMAVAVLSDRPEVRELVRFLSRPGWGVEGARQPVDRFIPARRTLNVTACVDPAANVATNGWRVRLCQDVRAALDSGNWRFDAMLSMPPSVTLPFVRGMVDYVQSGRGSLDQILVKLDRAWPTS